METKTSEPAAAKIGISKVGARTILSPRDALTYRNCEEMETLFKGCTKPYKTEVIFDCKAVTFVDSEVLELLLRMHDDLRSRGGVLKIINLDVVCRDIFRATRLINILHVYKDVHEAIRSEL
jgi:anti-anti-sigma factor